MIAVVFALPQESRDFVAELEHAGVVENGRLPMILGNLNAREIMVAHTGIGAGSAALHIASLLTHHPPRILISTGFAGGLDPRLRIADIVVAENFSDSRLLQKMRSLRNERVFHGTLTSQISTVETPQAKAALARETGVLAVDMETQTVFNACSGFGIPMLSIRAISDTAMQSLPVPFAIWFDAEKQQPRVGSLLRFLARHPSTIAEFARFASGIPKARTELTRFLVRFLQTL